MDNIHQIILVDNLDNLLLTLYIVPETTVKNVTGLEEMFDMTKQKFELMSLNGETINKPSYFFNDWIAFFNDSKSLTLMNTNEGIENTNFRILVENFSNGTVLGSLKDFTKIEDKLIILPKQIGELVNPRLNFDLKTLEFYFQGVEGFWKIVNQDILKIENGEQQDDFSKVAYLTINLI